MLWKCLSSLLLLLVATSSLTAQSIQRSGSDEGTSQPGIGREYETNILILGLRISSEFDDNALSDNRDKQLNVMTVVEPHLKWKGSHPRFDWLVDYGNGFSVSQQVPAYNSQSHLLDAAVQLRPSKRLRVVFKNSFFESKNPFDSFSAPASSSGLGVVKPNDFLLASTTNKMSEQASTELTYDLGPHATVGASGSFLTARYRAVGASQLVQQSLGDENSTNGQFFYSHHWTRHQWAGFDYEIQEIDSRNSSSLVHSVFYTHKISFSTAHVFSLFLGPERSSTQDLLDSFQTNPNFNQLAMATWRWAGGATYTWTAVSTQLTVGFSRRINSGSGLPGAALVTSTTANLRRSITQRWTTDLAGGYDRNTALDATRNELSIAWAAGGFSRTLRQGMLLDLKYWRLYQSAGSAVAGNSLADHNRVSVSLEYDLKAHLPR